MKAHKTKTPFLAGFAFFLMIAPGLQQPASAAAVVCKRYVNAIWSNTGGRMVLNSRPAPTSTAIRIWSICDLEKTGNRISPGICQVFYTDFLVSLTTDLPVTIVFDSATLDSDGLWAGTCDSITNWANVESAIKSIQIER